MSDRLAAWCHWKKREIDVSDDDLEFVAEIENLKAQLAEQDKISTQDSMEIERLGDLVNKLNARLSEAERVIKNLAIDLRETMPIIRNKTVGGARAYLEKYKGGEK
jgi:hypothetical protein